MDLNVDSDSFHNMKDDLAIIEHYFSTLTLLVKTLNLEREDDKRSLDTFVSLGFRILGRLKRDYYECVTRIEEEARKCKS